MTALPEDHEALAAFLSLAKASSYAADDDGRLLRLEDGGTECSHQAGEFAYRDRWYGEARFSGQEVAWRRGRVLWAMSYRGVTDPAAPAEFPHFHKRALRRAPAAAPFRGPALFREGELLYVNDWSGDLSSVRGVERCFLGERDIYRLEYLGGALG